MTNRIAFIASISDDLRQRGEDACLSLGWTQLPVPNEPPQDPPISAFEQLRHKLTRTLRKVDSVCLISAENADVARLEDMVQALASQHDCHYLSMETIDQTTLSSPATACIVIDESLSDVETTLKIVRVLSCIDSQAGPKKVPFKYLYSLYFDHVKHEASWANSRFTWFMFANSALLATFSSFRLSESVELIFVTWIVLVVGLALSVVTFLLQQSTFRAEQRAVNQCVRISDAWKKEVPHIADYLYDTPAGGNSSDAHEKAKSLMRLIIVLFIFLWAILGIVSLSRFPCFPG